MRQAQVLCSAACAALLITVAAVDCLAQADEPVVIRKISGTKVRTPEYRLVAGQAQARGKDWFSVTTQYDTAPDWIDEMTFSHYVLIRGKTADQPRNTLLTGDVTYVNVQKGRHLSDMYLHPSTLLRYGDVQSVAVVIRVQGRVVAMASEPSSTQRWWEQLTPVQGLVLNRMQTPFAMINFDNYEAIKFEGAAR